MWCASWGSAAAATSDDPVPDLPCPHSSPLPLPPFPAWPPVAATLWLLCCWWQALPPSTSCQTALQAWVSAVCSLCMGVGGSARQASLPLAG